MNTLILTLLTVFSIAANADQFKTVTYKATVKKLDIEIRYPQFFANSIPAYDTINGNIEGQLKNWICPVDDENDREMSSNIDARVVALNSRYVALRVSIDEYCGGAHPNYGVDYLTFDAQTGTQLKISREFGVKEWDEQDRDEDKERILREKLAGLLLVRIPKDVFKDCYSGMSKKEVYDMIFDFFPSVHGLAKNNTVVVGVNPPHVATPCRFESRLKYNEIKNLLTPTSYLHRWLK